MRKKRKYMAHMFMWCLYSTDNLKIVLIINLNSNRKIKKRGWSASTNRKRLKLFLMKAQGVNASHKMKAEIFFSWKQKGRNGNKGPCSSLAKSFCALLLSSGTKHGALPLLHHILYSGFHASKINLRHLEFSHNYHVSCWLFRDGKK